MYKIFLFDLGLNMKKRQVWTASEFWEWWPPRQSVSSPTCNDKKSEDSTHIETHYIISYCRVILPDHRVMGIVLSLVIGTSFTFLLRFFNFVPLSSSLMSSIPHFAQFCVSRLFTVIYFLCYMMVWRGWWATLTLLAPPPSLLLGLGASILFLSCSLASNVGPPLTVSHDSK